MSLRKYSVRRRAADQFPGRVSALARSLVAHLDAAHGGCLLLIADICLMNAMTPLLAPTARGWYAVLAASAGLVVVCALSTLARSPASPRTTLAFPFASIAALASLGVAAPHLAVAFTGLLTGCFVYLGLTQRPGTGMLVVPVGFAAFVVMNGGLDHTVAVRALIASMVWALIVATLATFTRHQSRMASALRHAALRDPLTGLPNRRDLEARLSETRAGDTFVLCDLDHFKELNDAHGHRAGDDVLADFGRMLRRELREGDYCARYGGEEFLILLPGTPTEHALSIVGRLRNAWRAMAAPTTFSAGLATCRAGGSAATTFAAADAALYQAKDAGRDRDHVHPGIVDATHP